MPIVSFVRRLVAVPGAALALGERLLDDLGRLHRQIDRASDEVARTRAAVEDATARLDELVDLSHEAMDRMGRASQDMDDLEDRADELQPIAEDASRTLDDVAAALDQVPGLDADGARR